MNGEKIEDVLNLSKYNHKEWQKQEGNKKYNQSSLSAVWEKKDVYTHQLVDKEAITKSIFGTLPFMSVPTW